MNGVCIRRCQPCKPLIKELSTRCSRFRSFTENCRYLYNLRLAKYFAEDGQRRFNSDSAEDFFDGERLTRRPASPERRQDEAGQQHADSQPHETVHRGRISADFNTARQYCQLIQPTPSRLSNLIFNLQSPICLKMILGLIEVVCAQFYRVGPVFICKRSHLFAAMRVILSNRVHFDDHRRCQSRICFTSSNTFF